MVANYHGLDFDLSTIRRRFPTSLRGNSLKSMIDMADAMGLTTRALRVSLESLANLRQPAILHWNMNHFVVLERIAGASALIHDPEGASRWISLERLSRHFTGVVLELQPGLDFQPSRERQRLRLSQLWQRISGIKRALLQTLLLSIMLEGFVLLSPYYLQLAVDTALPASDRNLLTVLALGFSIFALLNAAAVLLRSFVLLSAGTALGYGITINMARRLLRLPIIWFEKRHVGDVLSRFQSILPIRQLITQSTISTLVDGCLAICIFVMLLLYSVKLAMVATVALTINLIVRLSCIPRQRAAQEEVIVTGGREQSTMIESIRGIVTLRLFNREPARLALWQDRLTDSVNATFALSRIGLWQSAFSTLVSTIEVVVTVWLGIQLVMAGELTLGMLFAYSAYKAQFLVRTSSLVEQLVAFRMLKLHLERLSDIALTEEDKGFGCAVGSTAQLQGGLQLRNVSFRYGPNDPPILKGIDLSIEPGEHVAITGPSGGGKTTLVKILLGLVEPDDGQVMVDGLALPVFGYRNFRAQVGAVLQSDNLFAGSIIDNISLFDEVPDKARLLECTKAASVHDDIEAMSMGYDTLVGDMGSALSGGQKQRILLARALYKVPALLIMDEGTSHLDAHREEEVNRAVATMGITRIVIAHRRETIAAADRLFRLSEGRLEEVHGAFSTPRTNI